MGCVQSDINSVKDSSFMDELDPELWSLQHVQYWLKHSCDGELSDLNKLFQFHRISGLSFVNLTNKSLEMLGINQIGLREQFIYERDKVIQNYQRSSLKISCNIDVDLPPNLTYQAMIPSNSSPNTYIETPNSINSMVSPPISPRSLCTIDEDDINTPIETESLQPQIRMFAATISDTFIDTTINTTINLTEEKSTSSSLRPLSLNSQQRNAFNPHRLIQKYPTLLNKMAKTYSMDDAQIDDAPIEDDTHTKYTSYTINDKYNLNHKYCYYKNSKLLISGYIRIKIEENVFYNLLSIPNDLINQIKRYYFEYVDKHLYEISRDLWLKMNNNYSNHDNIDNNDNMNGIELNNYIEYILKMKYNDDENNSMTICNDLIKYKYIEFISSEPGMIIFNASKYYQYKFCKERDRNFIIEFEPDRKAWSRDTTIEVYSNTFNKWELGTIGNIEINNSDILLIDYGTPSQSMRKYVDRWDYKTVRSTKKFIADRRAWTKNSRIQIYLSQNYGLWYPATIVDIFYTNHNQPIVKVYYKDNDGNQFTHYFDIWSPSLRQPRSTIKYALNSKVRVWSNSKQCWIIGKIVQCLPEINGVRVVYGKSHKLLSIHSDDIKLLY